MVRRSRCFRVVAMFSVVVVAGCGSLSDAATTSSRTAKKRTTLPLRRTTTVTKTPGPTTTRPFRVPASIVTIAAQGQVAPGWSVWTSSGAPTAVDGALRAQISEGGFVSVSRRDDASFDGSGALRVRMVPGPVQWSAELSNSAGTPFGRSTLIFGKIDRDGALTATIALRQLNPTGAPFSRLYLFAAGSAASIALIDVSFVGAGAENLVATMVPATAIDVRARAVSDPGVTNAAASSQPQLPPRGRLGTPGYGSVITARAAVVACARTGPWRIMPLGDSLTGGSADVEGYGDSYRKWLWQLLRERGHYDIDFVGNLKNDDATFDGDHSGWGGYTVGPDNGGQANLYAHIVSFIAQPFSLNESSGKDWVSFADPDIVLLNIGTNDSEGDQAVVERRLNALVDVITKRAPTARIIVSSLPPSGGNFAIVAHVGTAAQKIARSSGGRVFYADIRDRMLAGDSEVGSAPFEVRDWSGAGDAVHMSATGGRKFAIAWLASVEAALNAPRCA